MGALQLKVVIKVLEEEASGRTPAKLLVETGRVGLERGQGVPRGGTGGAGMESRRSISRFGLDDEISSYIFSCPSSSIPTSLTD